jgi:poly(3-hydroxyalkanoate) synthetase
VRWAPPLFIVFSLVSRSYVLDLTPGNSFVEHLTDAGFDVFLLDWGVPDERDAHNLLEDYVAGYLPAAIDRAREVAGCDDVNMLGYCFGGVLALLYAASRMYALTVHSRSPSEACRSSRITGSAVVTTNLSRVTMKTAIAAIANVQAVRVGAGIGLASS